MNEQAIQTNPMVDEWMDDHHLNEIQNMKQQYVILEIVFKLQQFIFYLFYQSKRS